MSGTGRFTGNVVLGTTALSGGGAAQWLTANGTAYGGGLISSVDNVVKAYYYYDNTANAALVQANAGIGVQLWANNAMALSIATTGAATFSSSVSLKGGLTIVRSNTSESSIISNEGNLIFNARDNFNHVFQSNGTEIARINTSGAATFSSSVTAGGGLFSNNISSLTYGPSSTGAIEPGISEFISTGFNLANSGSQDISTITLPSNTQWKAIITGGFANNFEGGGLVSSNFSRDIDGTNCTIVAGSTTITFSRNASTGKLQVTNSNASARVTFVGTIHLVTFPQSYMPINTRAFFGNVGIGTASPVGLLDLGAAANGNALTWSNYSNIFSEYSSGALWMSSNFYGNIGSSGYKTSITATFGAAAIKVSGTSGSGNSGLLQFYVDDATSKTAGASFTPTERMRITSGGNVGIGTITDSGFKLDVNGTGRFSGALTVNNAQITQSSNSSLGVRQTFTSSSANGRTYSIGSNFVVGNGEFSIYDDTSGVERFKIASTGAATFSSSIAATSATFSSTVTNNVYSTPGSTANPFFNDVFLLGATNSYSKIQWGNEFNSTYGTYLRFIVNGSSNFNTPITALTLFPSGAATFTGSVSKASGTFKINHPLPSLTDTNYLVHSFIEGPRVDLIYRGKVVLVNGEAQINIDEVSRMTNGTFEALCREVQCFTTNESGWDLVKGTVIGNILYIESQNEDSTDEISWMVIGERKDKHIMETEWTDDDGKVIVEPLKSVSI